MENKCSYQNQKENAQQKQEEDIRCGAMLIDDHLVDVRFAGITVTFFLQNFHFNKFT